MLTADLVSARRRGGELKLVALDDEARARAFAIAKSLLDLASAHVGRTREELDAALASIDVGAREHKLRDGLAKLVEDRCTFDAIDDVDPEELRRDVFVRAAAARRALGIGERFDRGATLAEIARSRSMSADAVERALFSDLRAAHVLLSLESISPATLVDLYERGQAQAVLLRAVKVTIDVRCASPGAMRALFRRLKFLRLLHAIERTDDGGYRVVVDGPFSLFESITKYGLQLALVLPALDACDEWKLEADIRWGKDRTPLVFRLAGAARATHEEPPLPDEVAALVKSFATLDTAWRATPNKSILDLPGVGVCIPDLVFERGRGRARDKVYLEVMGYWSRAAVWKRVELVQSGLAEHVLFAVSSRLRVSEEVLDDEASSALYVYKGAMSARAVLERVEALKTRRSS